MKPLNTAELLDVWDATAGRPLKEKTGMLLARACSVQHIDEVFRLSIGDRDARLLQIREWAFGTTLRNKVNCPKCNDTLEWEDSTENLHLQPIPPSLSVREYLFEEDGFNVKLRLPNSLDIFETTKKQQNGNSFTDLLSKCVMSVEKNGQDCSFGDLSKSVLESLNDFMSAQDPQADIRMKLVCPACNCSWEMYFDIGAYFWEEINIWAKTMIHEVGLLARAFGWSEKDILSMSAHRRHMYLDMIQK